MAALEPVAPSKRARSVDGAAVRGGTEAGSDVEQFLQAHSLTQYSSAFERERVSLDILPALTESDLAALGLRIGDRARLRRAIRHLTQHQRHTSPTPPSDEDSPLPVQLPHLPILASGSPMSCIMPAPCRVTDWLSLSGSATSPFDALPDSLIVRIFAAIGAAPANVAHASLACRRFNTLARDPLLWRHVELCDPLTPRARPDGPLSRYFRSDVIQQLVARSPALESLSIVTAKKHPAVAQLVATSEFLEEWLCPLASVVRTLTSLDLSGCGSQIGPACLFLAGTLTSLVRLQLPYCFDRDRHLRADWLPDLAFSQLTSLTRLEHLAVGLSTASSLQHLPERLISLKSLELTITVSAANVLPTLGCMTRLETLHVRTWGACFVAEADVAHLTHLIRLRSLRLSSLFLYGEKALDFCQALSSLTSLGVSFYLPLPSLAPLRFLTQLKSLSVSWQTNSQRGMDAMLPEAFRTHTALEELRLSALSATTAEALRHLPRLQCLRIPIDAPLLDWGISDVLCVCRSLRRLFLYLQDDAVPAALIKLTRVSQLTKLQLTYDGEDDWTRIRQYLRCGLPFCDVSQGPWRHD